MCLTGVQAECPVQLNPRRVVVRFGGSVAVTCNTSIPHQGMGWEASEGAVPMTKTQNLITWRVSELKEWDIRPFCYINYKIGDPCEEVLPIAVYSEFLSYWYFSFHSQKYLINAHSSQQISECVNLPPQRLQTVCSSALWITADQWRRESSISSSVTFTMWLLFRISRSNGTKDRLCWIKPPSTTPSRLQWMKLSHSWSVQTELMMELNTDVKQSWIWEQKDLNLILQIHQILLMLTYTVSSLLLSKLYNSVNIFWMVFSCEGCAYGNISSQNSIFHKKVSVVQYV